MTARDDGWVRTHDEALDVLRYAAPGASVDVLPVAGRAAGSLGAQGASRRYVVAVHGAAPRTDLYTLPAPADGLARRVREIAAEALAARRAALTGDDR